MSKKTKKKTKKIDPLMETIDGNLFLLNALKEEYEKT